MLKNNQLQRTLFALAALFSVANLTAAEQPQNDPTAADANSTTIDQTPSKPAPIPKEAIQPSRIKACLQAILFSPLVWAVVAIGLSLLTSFLYLFMPAWFLVCLCEESFLEKTSLFKENNWTFWEKLLLSHQEWVRQGEGRKLIQRDCYGERTAICLTFLGIYFILKVTDLPNRVRRWMGLQLQTKPTKSTK